MAKARSIDSIEAEIQKVEGELAKLCTKQQSLEDKLLKLQKAKQEIEAKQIMDAFKKSGKSVHELLIFLGC